MTHSGQYHVSGNGAVRLTHLTWNWCQPILCTTITHPFILALVVVAADHFAKALLLAEAVELVVCLDLGSVDDVHLHLELGLGVGLDAHREAVASPAPT